MEIKEKEGYYLIKSKSAQLALVYSDKPLIKDEVNLCVNYHNPDCYSVNSPGEYEVKDIFVMVFEKNGRNQYLVSVEDINILLIDSQVELSEQDFDSIGDVDILILKGEIEVKMDLVKFVNDLDPVIFFLQTKTPEREKIETLFGAPVRAVGKKYKAVAEDFDIEEYKLEIFVLDEAKKE